MWYKGNLHTHTSEGDGSLSPREAADWYKSHGYDFMAFTDHNKMTELDYDRNSDFLVIENSLEFGQWETFLHVLGVGLGGRIRQEIQGKSHQEKIDIIKKNGGLAIICHPNWQWVQCGFRDLLDLANYDGIEIFNSLMLEEEGSAYALDKWDYVLSNGRKVLGFAVDDLHQARVRLMGRGWIMVRAGRLDRDSILEAIKAGDFYASSGVIIKDHFIYNDEIVVESEGGKEVVFIGENGRILEVQNGEAGRFNLKGTGSRYVRIEVRSGSGIAFTQPFFIR